MSGITVIGSTNIDLIMKMNRLPARGETLTGGEFMQTFGGKGANQAVAAARAGGNVTFISCVGDDHYGMQSIENFKEDGIDTSHIFTEKDSATGTALIMIGGDGDNMITVAPGANARMTPAHIDKVRHLLEESEYVLLQYEIPTDTLYHILETCHEMGKKVIFNLAPAGPCDPEHIGMLHTLVVNEVEAAYLSGKPVTTPAETREAATILQSMGAENVIITLGAEGSYVAGRDFREKIPAYVVKAVDATAAGDVYCGTLAVALVEGQTLEQAVAFASAASAISVTRMGAQPSAPSREEIGQMLLRDR